MQRRLFLILSGLVVITALYLCYKGLMYGLILPEDNSTDRSATMAIRPDSPDDSQQKNNNSSDHNGKISSATSDITAPLGHSPGENQGNSRYSQLNILNYLPLLPIIFPDKNDWRIKETPYAYSKNKDFIVIFKKIKNMNNSSFLELENCNIIFLADDPIERERWRRAIVIETQGTTTLSFNRNLVFGSALDLDDLKSISVSGSVTIRCAMKNEETDDDLIIRTWGLKLTKDVLRASSEIHVKMGGIEADGSDLTIDLSYINSSPSVGRGETGSSTPLEKLCAEGNVFGGANIDKIVLAKLQKLTVKLDRFLKNDPSDSSQKQSPKVKDLDIMCQGNVIINASVETMGGWLVCFNNGVQVSRNYYDAPKDTLSCQTLSFLLVDSEIEKMATLPENKSYVESILRRKKFIYGRFAHLEPYRLRAERSEKNPVRMEAPFYSFESEADKFLYNFQKNFFELITLGRGRRVNLTHEQTKIFAEGVKYEFGENNEFGIFHASSNGQVTTSLETKNGIQPVRFQWGKDLMISRDIQNPEFYSIVMEGGIVFEANGIGSIKADNGDIWFKYGALPKGNNALLNQGISPGNLSSDTGNLFNNASADGSQKQNAVLNSGTAHNTLMVNSNGAMTNYDFIPNNSAQNNLQSAYSVPVYSTLDSKSPSFDPLNKSTEQMTVNLTSAEGQTTPLGIGTTGPEKMFSSFGRCRPYSARFHNNVKIMTAGGEGNIKKELSIFFTEAVSPGGDPSYAPNGQNNIPALTFADIASGENPESRTESAKIPGLSSQGLLGGQKDSKMFLEAQTLSIMVHSTEKGMTVQQLQLSENVSFQEMSLSNPNDTLNIRSSSVEINNPESPNTLITLTGENSSLVGKGLNLYGDSIILDRNKNSFSVQGPGRLNFNIQTSEKQQESGLNLSGPLEVVWSENLVFDGKTLVFKAKPGDDVIVSHSMHTLKCPEVRLTAAHKVDLFNFDKNSGKNSLVDDIALIDCLGRGNQTVQVSIFMNSPIKSSDGSCVVEKAGFKGEVQAFAINYAARNFSGKGPGWFRGIMKMPENGSFGQNIGSNIMKNENAGSSSASKSGEPKNKISPALTRKPWGHLHLVFQDIMTGNLEEKHVTFRKMVQSVYCETDSQDSEIDATHSSNLPAKSLSLNTDELKILLAPSPFGKDHQKEEFELIATGSVLVNYDDIFGRGYSLTYSNGKKKIILQGSGNGSPASLYEQKKGGLSRSLGSFLKASYDLETEQLDVSDYSNAY